MCGHVFCYQCVSEYLTGDDNMCPATGCKELVGSDVIFSKATLRSFISDDLDGGPVNYQFVDKALVMQTDYNSSKIRAVLDILQAHSKLNSSDTEPCSSIGCNGSSSLVKEIEESSHSGVNVVRHTTIYSNMPNEGPIKTIVFSQWTSMLDLVEMSMSQSCIQYRRLDGRMSLASRDRAVRDFNLDPEVVVYCSFTLLERLLLGSFVAGNLCMVNFLIGLIRSSSTKIRTVKMSCRLLLC